MEVAVGMNGRVWVSASDASHVVVVGAALDAAQGLNPSESASVELVRSLCRASGVTPPPALWARSKRRLDEGGGVGGSGGKRSVESVKDVDMGESRGDVVEEDGVIEVDERERRVG